MKSGKDTNLGQVVGGKYRIDSVLRTSELGKVYNATHLSMDKKVSVKILSPVLAVDESIRKRFSEEARRLSHIAHPSILNVVDFGTGQDGADYIVYEGVEGVALKDEIVVEGAFSVERALEVTEQIAAGLVAAHSKGVVHGSLGGDKILLTKDEEGNDLVKILELGTIAPGGAADLELSSCYEYLSPEQCADPADFDERSDVYALGVMMYEMLSGELPFNGSNVGELMMKHATQPPPPLSAFRKDLPAELEPIVIKSLSKNRDLRHQSMGEVLAEVSELCGPQTSASALAAEKEGDGRWKTAFIVLASVSVMAVGLIYFTAVKKTEPTTVMQADTNGMPVQPINPATGISEQALSTIAPMSNDMMAQLNPQASPTPLTDTLPGGDGLNPWAGGFVPPSSSTEVTSVPSAAQAPAGPVITVKTEDPCNPLFPSEDCVVTPKSQQTTAPGPTPKSTPDKPQGNTSTGGSSPSNTNPPPGGSLQD